MKVVIIEDESLAAKRLESLLKEYDQDIQVLATLSSVNESVKWLSTNQHPDLLFMDIHLDDGQSFSIFDQVEVNSPVIFTTAYDDYMIKAFKVNSIDYLLKPIDFDELKSAINKYHKFKNILASDAGSIKELLNAALKIDPKYKSRFLITQGTKIKSVSVDEISYFYSEEKVTFLVTEDGHKLPVDYSLDKLVNILDPHLFFRVNRQYIIKMSAIASINKFSPTRLKVILNPATSKEVFVSIEKYTAFKEWLDS